MAEPKTKSKGGDKGKAKGADSGAGIGDALFVAFIFALPLIVTLWPLLLLFKENAVSSFFDIWRGMVKPIVMTLNAAIIAFIVYLVLEIWPLQVRPRLTRERKTEVVLPVKDPAIFAHWQTILAKAEGAKPDDLRLAIIEADALVDSFLKRSGYVGEHMADRLSRLSPQGIQSLNDLWNAHRVRNGLVHTPGASVSKADAERALNAFERFLKEMDAI